MPVGLIGHGSASFVINELREDYQRCWALHIRLRKESGLSSKDPERRARLWALAVGSDGWGVDGQYVFGSLCPSFMPCQRQTICYSTTEQSTTYIVGTVARLLPDINLISSSNPTRLVSGSIDVSSPPNSSHILFPPSASLLYLTTSSPEVPHQF